MDRPITRCPASASRAAATEESTPPDIAATTLMTMGSPLRAHGSGWLRLVPLPRPYGRQTPQLFDDPREDGYHAVDVFFRVAGAQAEADPVLGAIRRQVHCP